MITGLSGFLNIFEAHGIFSVIQVNYQNTADQCNLSAPYKKSTYLVISYKVITQDNVPFLCSTVIISGGVGEVVVSLSF